jgi:hypothetical protein
LIAKYQLLHGILFMLVLFFLCWVFRSGRAVQVIVHKNIDQMFMLTSFIEREPSPQVTALAVAIVT